MILSIITLSLIGAAATSPVFRRQNQSPTDLPPTSKSTGFNLIVNVTDSGRDFTPSLQNKYINSIHVGAGLSLLGVSNKEDNPRVFYVNGTAEEFWFAKSTVISDSGTPASPYGISLTPDSDSSAERTAHLNAGSGETGIGLTRWSVPYVFLYPETYAVCNESITYYQGKHFLIVKQFDLGNQDNAVIPDNCIPVRLFAQCTPLNDLPKDAISSHAFAFETQCYEDVASIDWSRYRPW